MADNSTTPATHRLAVLACEWLQFWRALPLRWIWLILFTAWTALFTFQGNSTLGYVRTPSLFGWLAWVHSQGMTDAHGSFSFAKFLASDSAPAWIMPVVFLLVLWSRRHELAALPKGVWWPGLALLALAAGLHVLGFAIQQTRISLVAFLLGLYGLTGLVWGPRWLRETLFPFLLLGFCIPLANSGEFLTFPLRRLVSESAVGISRYLLGMDVVCEGTQIFNANRTLQYDVAPACSGIRSLVTLGALTLIYGYLSFRATWKRLTILALAAPLAVAGNTLRITCAILIGEVFGQAAGAKVEQNLGLLTFLVALGGLLLAGRWLREARPPSAARPDAPTPAPLPVTPAAPRGEPSP